jgi:tRNA-Thr(GGU) m(6)t(6)A37 methyltransferase TsaA
MDEITLKPIGVAKNNIKEPQFGGFDDEITDIVLDDDFAGGLDDITEYSHVIVVFWMDQVDECNLHHRPQGNPDVPVVGIFACRCPQRPNPIAISTVRLLAREGNKIRVKGLDAIDGTPVIDIKPVWPKYDEGEDVRVPGWVDKLDL